MKNLKLRMEDLRIESFDTAPGDGRKGTVMGQQCTCTAECESCEPCANTQDCLTHATGDFTCAGYATRYEGGRFCVYC